MMVVVAYDVNTETEAGKRRLRKVAKECVNYGQRVQNSVFECLIDPAQLVQLRAKLVDIMDLDKDSLRFYMLGTRYQSRIEVVGKPGKLRQDDILIL